MIMTEITFVMPREGRGPLHKKIKENKNMYTGKTVFLVNMKSTFVSFYFNQTVSKHATHDKRLLFIFAGLYSTLVIRK